MTPKKLSGKPITYASSGVDIEAGDALVDFLKTKLPHIGGFSGLFPFPLNGYKEPMLVAGTDGVGTKLMVHAMAGDYTGVGFDLVGMVVNDLIVCGAEPLFFLDYIGTSKLRKDESRQILGSILKACERAGCLLLGGETAEMPGFYRGHHTELVGFSVGVVDRSKVIDGSKIRSGDALIGVPSNGLHSNGYSLARKIAFDKSGCTIDDKPKDLKGRTVSRELLRPTEIYVPLARALKKARVPVRGMAHITGGGISGNLVRVLPEGVGAMVDTKSWKRQPIFNWLQNAGNVPEEEMYKVFNMGIGLILVVPARSIDRALSLVRELYPKASQIGIIEKGPHQVNFV
jgi:phosphoribosylformylglycinamidine cyclo-ligase